MKKRFQRSDKPESRFNKFKNERPRTDKSNKFDARSDKHERFKDDKRSPHKPETDRYKKDEYKSDKPGTFRERTNKFKPEWSRDTNNRPESDRFKSNKNKTGRPDKDKGKPDRFKSGWSKDDKHPANKPESDKFKSDSYKPDRYKTDRSDKYNAKPDRSKPEWSKDDKRPADKANTDRFKNFNRDEKPKRKWTNADRRIPAPPDYRFNKTGSQSNEFSRGKQKKVPLDSRIKKTGGDTENDEMRLNRFVANSGICSRREADKMIEQGLISVNGKVVTELGTKVKRSDSVKYNEKILRPEKPVYVLLNKPKDFITTVDDPENRKTVMQLVASACNERIYPVGRLDRNTTGLLLLTNDGDMAVKLSHPSTNIKKLYQVDLDKPVTKPDLDKLAAGVELEDGKATIDGFGIVTPDNKSLGIELHSGKNRIVRRIFESLGYEVLRLDRVMYAGLTKKDLPRGRWRYLSEQEVIRLKHFIK